MHTNLLKEDPKDSFNKLLDKYKDKLSNPNKTVPNEQDQNRDAEVTITIPKKF